MFSFTPRWTSLQKLYIIAVTLCYSGQSKLLCATSDDAHMQTVDDATKLIDPGPGRSKGFEAGVEIASLLNDKAHFYKLRSSCISSVALVLTMCYYIPTARPLFVIVIQPNATRVT